MSVVTLRVTSGKHEGEEVVLENGRSAIIGQALPSRLIIADDETLAKAHFSLQFVGGRCRIFDLSTPAGTFVNGQKITQAEVADGAEIKAGGTTFQVTFAGAGEPAAGPAPRPAAAAPPAATGKSEMRAPAEPVKVPTPTAGAAAAQSLAKLQLQEEACTSGLVRFTTQDGLTAVPLLRMLGQSIPLTALMDLGKLEIAAPADIKVHEYLFDWMPAEVATANSPWILCPADTGEYYKMVEKGWGGGGIVCVLSRRKRAELTAHLRAAVKLWNEPPPRTAPRSILGFYLPAVMSAILHDASGDLAGKLMAGIDAVVVESDKAPGGWELLAGAEFRSFLTSLGATCTVKEKPKDAPAPDADAKAKA